MAAQISIHIVKLSAIYHLCPSFLTTVQLRYTGIYLVRA
jgi:hypothetical protein